MISLAAAAAHDDTGALIVLWLAIVILFIIHGSGPRGPRPR